MRIEAPDLAVLPWELLFDSSEGDYLGLSPETPLVRHLELERASEGLSTEPPLRILAMVGARQGLDAEKEKRQMERAAGHLVRAGALTLQWLEGHSWQALRQGLEGGLGISSTSSAMARLTRPVGRVRSSWSLTRPRALAMMPPNLFPPLS